MRRLLNNFPGFMLLLLLVFSGCRKDAAASLPDTSSSGLPATVSFGNRGLQWIMDKYRNDNMHIMVATHRGNWGTAPENSLQGMQQCIDNGVEILELDVRLTSDEQLILMHDKTLGRTATGSGEIKYHPLSYLKQQFLIGRDGKVTDQRIPTLEEALLLAKGKVLIMLDKSEYLLPWIEKVLEKTGTARQVVLLEFNDYKKTTDHYGSLLNEVIYVPGIHQSNEHIGEYIQAFEQSVHNPSCYAFWIKHENSAVLPFITTVQQSGDRLWINTVDKDQCAGHTDSVSLTDPVKGWGWAIDKGANIILTDMPDKLIAYLLSINRRN
jgi:glycerophosphoryl diester phosphodiesterase